MPRATLSCRYYALVLQSMVTRPVAVVACDGTLLSSVRAARSTHARTLTRAAAAAAPCSLSLLAPPFFRLSSASCTLVSPSTPAAAGQRKHRRQRNHRGHRCRWQLVRTLTSRIINQYHNSYYYYCENRTEVARQNAMTAVNSVLFRCEPSVRIAGSQQCESLSIAPS